MPPSWVARIESEPRRDGQADIVHLLWANEAALLIDDGNWGSKWEADEEVLTGLAALLKLHWPRLVSGEGVSLSSNIMPAYRAAIGHGGPPAFNDGPAWKWLVESDSLCKMVAAASLLETHAPTVCFRLPSAVAQVRHGEEPETRPPPCAQHYCIMLSSIADESTRWIWSRPNLRQRIVCDTLGDLATWPLRRRGPEEEVEMWPDTVSEADMIDAVLRDIGRWESIGAMVCADLTAGELREALMRSFTAHERSASTPESVFVAQHILRRPTLVARSAPHDWSPTLVKAGLECPDRDIRLACIRVIGKRTASAPTNQPSRIMRG